MRIDEIFYSIQGEGTRRGRPCAFVRLTGCPLRCVWCDTSYAFSGGSEMGITEVLEALVPYPTRLVCVTGGEPLAQASVHELMESLLEQGYTVLLETSGALDIRGVDPRVHRIVDLKAPGSGEEARNLWSNLDALGPGDELKIVLADRGDYEWAKSRLLEHRLERRVAAVLLSPVHGVLDAATLAAWILEDGLPVSLQQQEHKLLWPGVERGV
jgi:7-carboxy-7-deazaguanine synthase